MNVRLARACGIFACVGGLALAAPAALRAAFAIGTEFAINSYTSANQRAASVGLDADGDFVVVWQSYNQDGNQYGVFGRRFNSAGVASGVEFQVNTHTSGHQMGPRAAMEDNGDFAVVWASAQDGSSYGVFGRRFTSSGAPLAQEFQVNTFTPGQQVTPALAMQPNGDFVVAWGSNSEDGLGYGVFARRFASDGNPSTGPLLVNTYTPNNQGVPSVAVEGDGDFVVVWRSDFQDGDSSGVFGRRFASSGSAVGGEFQIHTYTTSFQNAPTVAMLAGGAFVVAWNSNFPGGSLFEIRGRRFNSSGAATGDEFQVNTVTGGTQNYARLASDDAGAFLVVWEFIGVRARSFGPSGPDGPEFQIDAPTGGGYALALDINAGGDAVVTWSRFGADGGQSGVLGRRYTLLSPLLDIDQSGAAAPLTDGLLLLRHRFGFSGATLTNGAIDTLNCMRCEGAAIDAFIDDHVAAFDIDGDGATEPLTDGLLALRYLFGFRGASLVSGAVDLGSCARCNAGLIEPFIAGLLTVP